MSERYKTLYRIPGNLYTTGSPIIIAAGALLKDNQTGKVLAQIKFKSITDKRIKAVKIRIFSFDVAGLSVGDAVEHQYLDLNINRNDEFGSKEAVPLTLDTTRSFSAQVLSVIFSDGSIWDAPPNAEWNKLLEQKEISDLLNDGELVKQYILETGGKSKYVPVEADDFWLCSCGAINHKSETNCVSCKKTLPALLDALDISTLTSKKNSRIEKECNEAESQSKKHTAKMNKIIFLCIVAVVCFVLIVFLVNASILSGRTTYSSVDEMRQAVANCDYAWEEDTNGVPLQRLRIRLDTYSSDDYEDKLYISFPDYDGQLEYSIEWNPRKGTFTATSRWLDETRTFVVTKEGDLFEDEWRLYEISS